MFDVLGNADKMISKLEEYSDRLGISVNELIDRYVRIELYMDDFYDEYPSKVLEEERRKNIEEFIRRRGKIRVQKRFLQKFMPKGTG